MGLVGGFSLGFSLVYIQRERRDDDDAFYVRDLA
jgi:hypothetical protein